MLMCISHANVLMLPISRRGFHKKYNTVSAYNLSKSVSIIMITIPLTVTLVPSTLDNFSTVTFHIYKVFTNSWLNL